MDKMEFVKFCKEEFIKNGFYKIKKNYYLLGEEVLCGINLQKSNYSSTYYVNYFYCIGNYEGEKELPIYYDSDIQGRIHVMSKKQKYKGECFATAMIEYEEYTEDELRLYFEKDLKEKILPPVYEGKRYILENLNTKYYLTLNQEEVVRKLQL